MAEVLDIFNIQPSVISRDLKGKYVLLYGQPKVGKTSFAVQAPRAFVCAFEIGVNALGGTRYAAMDKWTTFKRVIKQLRDPRGRETYDTIVIDTASIAFDLCEKYILQREGVDSIRDIPWGQGWGMVKQEFQECLREITMLGYGLVLICHSKERQSQFTDEEGNALMSHEPDLSKNAYQVCNAICDVIGYIGVEFTPEGKSERYLYTRQTPTVFAGSRYKYLEPKIPFGYTELVNAIGDAIDKQGELDGATIVDHVEAEAVKTRPFKEVMDEAKLIWTNYINSAESEEDKEMRFNILNDIIIKVFGKPTKISAVLPSQQDLVELFISEAEELVK